MKETVDVLVPSRDILLSVADGDERSIGLAGALAHAVLDDPMVHRGPSTLSPGRSDRDGLRLASMDRDVRGSRLKSCRLGVTRVFGKKLVGTAYLAIV